MRKDILGSFAKEPLRNHCIKLMNIYIDKDTETINVSQLKFKMYSAVFYLTSCLTFISFKRCYFYDAYWWHWWSIDWHNNALKTWKKYNLFHLKHILFEHRKICILWHVQSFIKPYMYICPIVVLRAH